METANEVAQRLARILALGSAVEPKHAWRALSVEQRVSSLQRVVIDDTEQDARSRGKWRRLLVLITIDTSRGFRPTAIRGWPIERLIGHVARLNDPRHPPLIEEVVLKHHDEAVLGRVQAPLLDRLGVPHVDGVVENDGLDALDERSSDALCQAALDAWWSTPTLEMAVYLLCLVAVIPKRWSALGVILPAIGEELAGAEATGRVGAPVRVPPVDVRCEDGRREASEVSEASSEERRSVQPPRDIADEEEGDAVSYVLPDDEEEEELEEEDVEEVQSERHDRALLHRASETAVLSVLDEEIIRRIADSLQEVVGAPDEQGIDQILDELIKLNATRHQSFYHLGFHDAVRQRGARSVLPAQNAHRWRWYLAGFVAGLARLGDHAAIVSLWEARAELRGLGDTALGPSRYSVLNVVNALRHERRYAEAASFASPEAIGRMPQLANAILELGTSLQRKQLLAEASPIFERLLNAESRSRHFPDGFWATVKRRHAHCLRAEGKLEAARRLLEEALDEAAPAERAMVIVDLGLIDASYGRLTDLRLPASWDAAHDVATRLDRGERRFREAEELDVSTSSHAHYVLGIRELLRRQYPDAERRLSIAVSQFDLERERYEPANLLRRAHLHLAVARCANVESDASRLDQAIRDIVDGLTDPADLPDIFIGEVIAGLMLRDDVKADALVERLLTEDRDALLDALGRDDKAHRSAAVADALGARFRRERRTERQRMTDGIDLIRMLLLQGRYDEASRALDEVETLAVRSTEGGQFLSYLESAGDSLTAVWESSDIVDARVRVLEAMARYEEAADALRSAFARALARDDAQGRLDAFDVLDTLAGYGCVEASELEGMRARVDRATVPLSPPSKLHRPIHVLVVGGNEVQAQYDGTICAHYAACRPWVTVEFMHTGWSSNWGDKVDEFSRRLVRADAVVLIYLMRTEFGRSIRKRMNGRPWRGCGGKGRESIQRAIDEVVGAVHIC